jgi:hypothetical protein
MEKKDLCIWTIIFRKKSIEEFKKANPQTKWLVTKFKSTDLPIVNTTATYSTQRVAHSKGRIIQKLDGKSEEVIL